jgi:hypothetical protein
MHSEKTVGGATSSLVALFESILDASIDDGGSQNNVARGSFPCSGSELFACFQPPVLARRNGRYRGITQKKEKHINDKDPGSTSSIENDSKMVAR